MYDHHDATYQRLLKSRKWRLLRHQVLKLHPLCQRCQEVGRVSAAEEVHHIIPIQSAVTDADKERLAYNPSNLQALCHNCHVLAHRYLGKQSKAERDKRKQQILDNFKKNFLE